MISRWLLLTLFAAALTPRLLHAQQAYPNEQKQRLELRFTLPETVAAQNEKMYEDIEILRRILDRKLTSLYPSVPSKGERTDPTKDYYGMLSGPQDVKTGSLIRTRDGQYQIDLGWSQPTNQGVLLDNLGVLLFDAHTPYPAAIPFRSLEGVYIKGQGVVYTATLSSLQPSAKSEADSSVKEWRVAVVETVTEWDSIRRQVRKEEPKKPEESKPPSLSDVLLRVLADNGHNFSQLGENESLTLVLTVHEPSHSSPAPKSGTGSAKAESNAAAAGNDADAQRDAGNLGMLGSLHLKQEKYVEAIQAFRKLLSWAKTPEQEAIVRRRLAQCYLGLGEDEKAHVELVKAVTLLKKGKEDKGKPAAGKSAATLPVKLIISAPKKLLDQVKEGKISFEEFRRQASVETLRFGDRR